MRMFDLHEGLLESTIKNINPVHCVIIRSNDVEQIIDILKLIPIVPNGSIWVYIRDERNKDGSLKLLPETLVFKINKLFYLADKVVCQSDTFKRGMERREKNYLATSMVVLRFTVGTPEMSWTTQSLSNSVWERTLEEDHSWYSKQISYTCPIDGVVLDPLLNNGYVGEASIRLGRHFVGIGMDVKKAYQHINAVASKIS